MTPGPASIRTQIRIPASALATVDGVTYRSSILPWRTAGSTAPWIGDTTASRMAATLDQLRLRLQRENLVWGGDWNATQSAWGLSDHDLYIVEI